MKHRIFISPTGGIACIYHDRLRPLLALGTATIRRASHVEPTSTNEWTADLTPVGGPVLGPFPEREAMLQAERTWLDAHPEAWRNP